MQYTDAIHRNEQQREREKEQVQEASEKDRKLYEQQIERPIIVFEKIPESKDSFIWRVINIGRGPALDITVFFDNRDTNLFYLLPQQGQSLYYRVDDNQTWEVWYKDIFDNQYTSKLVNDETKIE